MLAVPALTPFRLSMVLDVDIEIILPREPFLATWTFGSLGQQVTGWVPSWVVEGGVLWGHGLSLGAFWRLFFGVWSF
jgi:hypothetical protein